MKRFITILCVVTVSTFVVEAADTTSTSPSLSELRENGAFGFPQKNAKVVCDRPDLRFSVWNNGEYLVAQAILWNYGHATLGEADGNRLVTDWSAFILAVGADGKPTYNIDRHYALNAPAGLKGLHYFIPLSAKSITPMKSDSKGRGAMRCLETSEGKNVRVDTYAIPLEEIQRHVGETIRFCYIGNSPKWLLDVNSTGYDRDLKDRTKTEIPLSSYHEYALTSGSEIDVAQFPDDPRVMTP